MNNKKIGLILEGLNVVKEAKKSDDFMTDLAKNFNKMDEDELDMAFHGAWVATTDISVVNIDDDSDDFKEETVIKSGSKFKVTEYYDGNLYITYEKKSYGIPLTKKFLKMARKGSK